MLDVGAARKNALKINPLTLNINPDIYRRREKLKKLPDQSIRTKENVDSIELFLPRAGLLFEDYM